MSTLQKKELILISLTLVFSVLFLYRFVTFVNGDRFTLLTITLFLAIIPWIALIALALALIETFSGSAIILFALPFIVLAVGRFTAGAAGGALLFLLFLLSTRRQLSQAVRNQIKYRTVHVFYRGTQMLMVGVLAAMAGLALPAVQELTADDLRISEGVVNVALKPLEPVIQGFVPRYGPSISVDELIDAQLEQQIENLPPGTELSPEQRQQIRQQLSQQLHTPVEGQESLTTVVTRVLNSQINSFARRNPVTLALTIIAIAFLALRALVPVFVWPTLGMIAFFVYLTRRFGLANLFASQQTVETLKL